MPIYEYICNNCDHHFEQIQKITEPPIKQCPICFKDSVERLISAVGFQLKGTGWYVTDFKDKKSHENKESSPKENTKEKPKQAEHAVPKSTSETTK